jgi:hypothetical protein
MFHLLETGDLIFRNQLLQRPHRHIAEMVIILEFRLYPSNDSISNEPHSAALLSNTASRMIKINAFVSDESSLLIVPFLMKDLKYS